MLGRKSNMMDTQSAPQTAKALAQKAIDQNAYVVMGPVFSGSIIVSMVETKRAEIANFTGGEAASITQQGNPYIFRTSFTQSSAMPKVARYIKDDPGQGAHRWPSSTSTTISEKADATMMKALDAQGIKVIADVSTDPGQLDFSGAVLKAESRLDALFRQYNEEESARAFAS
jgi:branched-chain amino acid transport system substrate-binding protein